MSSSRGRCPQCKQRHKLTAGGVMIAHPDTAGDRCAGAGGAPVDPAHDDTPDHRDRMDLWDATRRLERLRTKDFLTDRDRAEVARVRRVRDDAAAGTGRVRRSGRGAA